MNMRILKYRRDFESLHQDWKENQDCYQCKFYWLCHTMSLFFIWKSGFNPCVTNKFITKLVHGICCICGMASHFLSRNALNHCTLIHVSVKSIILSHAFIDAMIPVPKEFSQLLEIVFPYAAFFTCFYADAFTNKLSDNLLLFKEIMEVSIFRAFIQYASCAILHGNCWWGVEYTSAAHIVGVLCSRYLHAMTAELCMREELVEEQQESTTLERSLNLSAN